MIRFSILAAALLILPSAALLTSCDKATASGPQVELEISGMTWGNACVKAVRSALESVDGVTQANVSMPDKAVVIFTEGTADPDQNLPALIAAVDKAGYGAKKR